MQIVKFNEILKRLFPGQYIKNMFKKMQMFSIRLLYQDARVPFNLGQWKKPSLSLSEVKNQIS